jgi:peptide/histidine transporter 3/4
VLSKLKIIYLQGKFKEETEELTLDGSVDWHGRPAIRAKSGRWFAGTIILCKFQTSIYIQFFIALILFLFYFLCFLLHVIALY